MQITHEHAHRLIQLNLDNVLSAEQSTILFAHLHDCTTCQSYANELKEVETLLSPVMKRQWMVQPIPLSIPALISKKEKRVSNLLLTMRTAAMGLVVLALFFSLWQFMSTGPTIASPVPFAVPLVPTPSMQTAQSTRTTETCEMLLYVVQNGDTLASIARRFSVAEDELSVVNGLNTTALSPSMELLIPSCETTPTGTVHPATYTTTYTPILRPTTSTPGG